MDFKKTVLISLVAAVMVYYLYNPQPANLEQPYQHSLMTTMMRIVDDLAKISAFIGYKEVLVFRRDFLGSFATPPREGYTDVKIVDAIFNGVPVSIFKPEAAGEELSAGLIFVHGGGFVMGCVEMYDSLLVNVVRRTQVTVVAIDYRLGPEYPNPAQREDCQAVSRYVFSNAEKLGIDPKRIGIAGDSAGGNMAASLSLKFRDAGPKPQFAYQILIYPWVQSMDFGLPSYLENNVYNDPLLTAHSMALMTLGYLGINRNNANKLMMNQHVSEKIRAKYATLFDVRELGYQEESNWYEANRIDTELAELLEAPLTDGYTFPLMADSFADLPPALVMTMGLDTLRDEGLLYKNRLVNAGVETEHYHDDLCWHGAATFADGPIIYDCGVRLVDRIITYINKANGKSATGQ